MAGELTGNVVARRVWFAIAPDGSPHEIPLCVFAPEPQGDDWWASVTLGPLDPGRVTRIIGIDSWQAINLAQRFVETMVASSETAGWRFFWREDGESATASHLGIQALR